MQKTYIGNRVGFLPEPLTITGYANALSVGSGGTLIRETISVSERPVAMRVYRQTKPSLAPSAVARMSSVDT